MFTPPGEYFAAESSVSCCSIGSACGVSGHHNVIQQAAHLEGDRNSTIEKTEELHSNAGPMSMLMSTRDGEQCLLDLLVPNYDVAHPTVSASMNRLVKKAQRIKEAKCRCHTPLLEVREQAAFELEIPWGVQVSRLLVYQSPACFTDLSIAGMFY